MDSLFLNEEKTIKEAEEIVNRDENTNNPLTKNFSSLLKNYKRIYKQLKRLIKLSDKQQQRLNENRESLEIENYELVLELGQAFESFIRTLTTTIDAKHPLTAGHSHRVTEYGLFFGRNLGFDDEELEVLKYTGLLHDIGKIGVPDAILTKKGRFTEDERRIMNNHASWTYRIIEGMRLPKTLKDIPRMAACHHEKMDGTGYPYCLVGDKIPFFSRIIAVSDVFDALTSLRDYPKYDQEKILGLDPMSTKKAFTIIERGRTTHFDPEVTDILFKNRSDLEDLCFELQNKAIVENKTY